MERIQIDERRAGILRDYFLEGIQRKHGNVLLTPAQLRETLIELVGECHPVVTGIVVEVDRDNGRVNVLIPIERRV
jgi:hypothetical protein